MLGTVGLIEDLSPSITIHEGNSLHVPKGTLALVVDVTEPDGRPRGPERATRVLHLLVLEQLVQCVSARFRTVKRASKKYHK